MTPDERRRRGLVARLDLAAFAWAKVAPTWRTLPDSTTVAGMVMLAIAGDPRLGLTATQRAIVGQLIVEYIGVAAGFTARPGGSAQGYPGRNGDERGHGPAGRLSRLAGRLARARGGGSPPRRVAILRRG